MAIVGVVVFSLGYSVSLMAAEIGFHPTGVVNRTAIAATLGVAQDAQDQTNGGDCATPVVGMMASPLASPMASPVSAGSPETD